MKENEEIQEALEYFLGKDEAEDIVKSITTKDKEKEDLTVTDKEDMEKSKTDKKEKEDLEKEKEEPEDDLKKAKTEMDDLEKSYSEKKAMYDNMVAKKKGKENKEDLEKSLTSDDKKDELIKSMALSYKENQDKTEELQKSVTAMTELISGLEEKVDTLGKSYDGHKAVTNRDFLKKSVTTEEGFEVISCSQNKLGVQDALTKGLRSAVGDDLKSQYEECILNYTCGGATPTKDVACDLFDSYKIRLVK